jgi:hypothetical protein
MHENAATNSMAAIFGKNGDHANVDLKEKP